MRSIDQRLTTMEGNVVSQASQPSGKEVREVLLSDSLMLLDSGSAQSGGSSNHHVQEMLAVFSVGEKTNVPRNEPRGGAASPDESRPGGGGDSVTNKPRSDRAASSRKEVDVRIGENGKMQRIQVNSDGVITSTIYEKNNKTPSILLSAYPNGTTVMTEFEHGRKRALMSFSPDGTPMVGTSYENGIRTAEHVFKKDGSKFVQLYKPNGIDHSGEPVHVSSKDCEQERDHLSEVGGNVRQKLAQDVWIGQNYQAP